MGLLKPADINTTAFLKLGFLGFEGSGKTFTAIDIAIGITKKLGGKKIAFFDTEKGSSFHIKRVKEAGLQLEVMRSRSFQDLLTVIDEAEKGKYSFLIIDSITHVWRDLCDSFLKKSNRKFLTIKDWGTLKTEWGQYSSRYVNSALHVAMLGRAGYEYDTEEGDDGKKEMVKVGTKMRVETETGYEPDLLDEMYRVPKSEVLGAKPGTKKAKTMVKGFVHRALVLKDRSDTITGRTFDNPTYKDFLPVIQSLNLGGAHEGFDATRNSEALFDSPDTSWSERARVKEIALEELKIALAEAGLDGTAQAVKLKRIEVLKEVFGTAAGTAIESMSLGDVQAGIKVLRGKFNLDAPRVESAQVPVEEPVKDGVPF